MRTGEGWGCTGLGEERKEKRKLEQQGQPPGHYTKYKEHSMEEPAA